MSGPTCSIEMISYSRAHFSRLGGGMRCAFPIFFRHVSIAPAYRSNISIADREAGRFGE